MRERGQLQAGVAGVVSVLLGNGDGTFQPAATFSSGAYNASFVAVADVNGDGKPDLIVPNQCMTSSDCGSGSPGEVSVFLGNGDGTFQTPELIAQAAIWPPLSRLRI